MKLRDRWIATVVALLGIGVCLASLSRFISMLARNGLPWSPDMRARDLYLLVGDSYANGFVVGFFLSFSLVLLAVAVSSWWEGRRGKKPNAPAPRAPIASARAVAPNS